MTEHVHLQNTCNRYTPTGRTPSDQGKRNGVGGASLTLSTRAPWRTELIARLGPIDGLRAPAGHDLGEVLRVEELGIN